MCEIIVNDIFDELREENNRLSNELSFEINLNKILENIKNCSLILKNNCICSENIEVFKKLNDFEIDYKILKSKQKVYKTENKPNVCDLGNNGHNGHTSGILISNITSIGTSDKTAEVSERVRSSRESSNAVNSEYNCRECDQKFGTELDLVLHVNRNHKDIESFVCHECTQVFNSRDVFASHLLEHEANGGNGRSKSVSKPKSKRTITDYLRSYRRPNPSETVPTNSIKSDNKMRLITEMFEPNKRFKEMDTNSQILTNNIKLEANDEIIPKIQCPECHMSWNSTEAMESHIRQCHPSLVCGKCRQWFYSKSEVLSHLATYHNVSSKGNTFRCISCNYKTPSRYCFDRHKRNRVCSKGQFKCPNLGCNCTFTKADILGRHRNICTKKNSVQVTSPKPTVSSMDKEGQHFVCGICHFKSDSRKNLANHLSTHSNDRPFKCDFNDCDKTYKKRIHLKDHQKRVHPNSYQMDLLRELNQNIRNVSKLDLSDVNPVEEPPKDEQLGSDSVEQQPHQIKQEIKLEFISDSDNESILKDSSELRDNKYPLKEPTIESHSISNRKYLCNLCGFDTNNKNCMFKHEIEEHPQLRPFKCKVPNCDKAYTRDDSLRKHSFRAHGTSEKNQTNDSAKNFKISCKFGGKLFECNVCQFKTEFIHLLRRHMYSHSPQKPFKCGIDGCQYSANRKDILRSHQKRVHKMEGPNFVCNYQNCKRGFDSQLLLRQHMNSHKNRFMCRWEGCQFRTNTFAKLNEHRRTENHMPPQLL